MDLRKFPLDSQRCPLEIGSFGFDTTEMTYRFAFLTAGTILRHLPPPFITSLAYVYPKKENLGMFFNDTMNSVRSSNLSLEYQRFTPSVRYRD